MSALRILMGLVIGVIVIAASILAGQLFEIHPTIFLFGFMAFASLLSAWMLYRRSSAALQLYWNRRCTGTLWKKRFPESSSHAIREFLSVFVTAFMFPNKQLKFAPEDRIIEVYRAVYPDRLMPDALELETLAEMLEQKYGFSLRRAWHDEIMLGDVYALAAAL